MTETPTTPEPEFEGQPPNEPMPDNGEPDVTDDDDNEDSGEPLTETDDPPPEG
jgi:hypothetical protein